MCYLVNRFDFYSHTSPQVRIEYVLQEGNYKEHHHILYARHHICIKDNGVILLIKYPQSFEPLVLISLTQPDSLSGKSLVKCYTSSCTSGRLTSRSQQLN